MEQTPEKVLFAYLDALLELNRVCMNAADAAAAEGKHMPNLVPLRKQYAAIRRAHLTARKRTDILSWGRGVAAQLDRKNLVVKKVVEESPKRVAIYVFHKKDKDTVRYHLVLQKDGWRIDSVKERRGPKWVSLIL